MCQAPDTGLVAPAAIPPFHVFFPPLVNGSHYRLPDPRFLTRPPSPFQRFLWFCRGTHACVFPVHGWSLRSLGRGVGLNCVRSARQRAQTRSEHTYICGFRQPDLPRALPRRPVTARVSPVSPSLNKEGNAACASLACRKVTTRAFSEGLARGTKIYGYYKVLSLSGDSPKG